MKLINTRMKELRKDHKYTQMEVANKLGVSRITYQNYEYGKIRVPYSAILKLCNLYDCTADYLIGNLNAPTLNDIELSLKEVLKELESNEPVIFHGRLLDDNSRECLKLSIQNSLNLGKTLNEKD